MTVCTVQKEGLRKERVLHINIIIFLFFQIYNILMFWEIKCLFHIAFCWLFQKYFSKVSNVNVTNLSIINFQYDFLDMYLSDTDLKDFLKG